MYPQIPSTMMGYCPTSFLLPNNKTLPIVITRFHDDMPKI